MAATAVIRTSDKRNLAVFDRLEVRRSLAESYIIEDEVSDAQLEEILSVDTALWKDEVAGIEEFFGKFDRLPATLKDELNTLKNNIG